MRYIAKAAVIGALAIPMTLGMAGMAGANEGSNWYVDSASAVGDEGSISWGTVAYADDDGNALFKEFVTGAGPDGAFSGTTAAGSTGR